MVLKRASRRPVASANTSADDPAEAARQAAEPPDEHDHGRGHAEVDEVGEAVELGAELGLRLERARQPPVDAVEQGGDRPPARWPSRSAARWPCGWRSAGAQAEQGEEVRHQHAHGDLVVAEQQPARGGGAPRPPVSAAGDPWLSSPSSCRLLQRAPRARARSDLQIGQHGLAADRALADRDQGAAAGRQIEIDARAEADQAEPLADADAVALARRR